MKRNTPLFFTLFAAIVFCATVSPNLFAKTESSRLYLKSGLEVKKQPVVEAEERSGPKKLDSFSSVFKCTVASGYAALNSGFRL